MTWLLASGILSLGATIGWFGALLFTRGTCRSCGFWRPRVCLTCMERIRADAVYRYQLYGEDPNANQG